ncbi:MAG: phosphoadenosine phosphosulfate reductase family protein [Woeseiaceae bacterium]|nr:phosphoadenosine phosphosulfate reductase family protein [Woeseiaceae bacterium]
MPGTWFAGLRRAQSASARGLGRSSSGRATAGSVHPIADWSDRDVLSPTWNSTTCRITRCADKGYVSIGDHHTTRALHEVDGIEQTRFFGVQRECGLHDDGYVVAKSVAPRHRRST